MIHCGVYDVNGKFKNWLTAIYAMNPLEKRRGLWKEIKKIHHQQRGPWCLMGNFNNVLRANDRVGERIMHESKYKDLVIMMEQTGLCDMDSLWDHYTWSNKYGEGVIYSRIDRVISNVDWFQENMDTSLTIVPPEVSDHAMLCLTDKNQKTNSKTKFKFLKCVTTMGGFEQDVSNSWKEPMIGRPL